MYKYVNYMHIYRFIYVLIIYVNRAHVAVRVWFDDDVIIMGDFFACDVKTGRQI